MDTPARPASVITPMAVRARIVIGLAAMRSHGLVTPPALQALRLDLDLPATVVETDAAADFQQALFRPGFAPPAAPAVPRWQGKPPPLTFDEIERAVRIAVQLGTSSLDSPIP